VKRSRERSRGYVPRRRKTGSEVRSRPSAGDAARTGHLDPPPLSTDRKVRARSDPTPTAPGGRALYFRKGLVRPELTPEIAWVDSRIAGMGEPVAAVADGDAVAGTSGYAPEGESVPRGVFAHELLLQGPSRLDRVVVGRVRRQIHETNAVTFAEWPNTRIVMRLEVVHHQDVALAQLRQESGRQPCDKAISVRGSESRIQDDPTRSANRSVKGQVLAPVHRDAVDELGSSFDPGVAASHRGVHPRLVHEHQPIDRVAADPTSVGAAFRYDVGAQTLQRPSAFFLTT
jgi:hypothetical protein